MEPGGKKMKTKRYDQEFKEQIIRECQEVGNAALVARRHGLSKNTVHNWLKASRRNGSVVPLPKNKEQRLKEAERRLEELGRENDRLKRIVAEKELELAILKELRDLANPR
jgi:transposase-like protein